ncbi:hypothetical protein Acsp03_22170 [Actinomadura sp. NBRC 104412]|nr:hypothetical protein Acsp03_22170 [Actinomadura sp. NBRC 104412]
MGSLTLDEDLPPEVATSATTARLAHLVHPGDLVSFVLAEESELAGYQLKVVHVDAANRIIALGNDLAVPVPRAADQVSGRVR